MAEPIASTAQAHAFLGAKLIVTPAAVTRVGMINMTFALPRRMSGLCRGISKTSQSRHPYAARPRVRSSTISQANGWTMVDRATAPAGTLKVSRGCAAKINVRKPGRVCEPTDAQRWPAASRITPSPTAPRGLASVHINPHPSGWTPDFIGPKSPDDAFAMGDRPHAFDPPVPTHPAARILPPGRDPFSSITSWPPLQAAQGCS